MTKLRKRAYSILTLAVIFVILLLVVPQKRDITAAPVSGGGSGSPALGAPLPSGVTNSLDELDNRYMFKTNETAAVSTSFTPGFGPLIDQWRFAIDADGIISITNSVVAKGVIIPFADPVTSVIDTNFFTIGGNIDASQITSGTINNARLDSTVSILGQTIEFTEFEASLAAGNQITGDGAGGWVQGAGSGVNSLIGNDIVQVGDSGGNNLFLLTPDILTNVIGGTGITISGTGNELTIDSTAIGSLDNLIIINVTDDFATKYQPGVANKTYVFSAGTHSIGSAVAIDANNITIAGQGINNTFLSLSAINTTSTLSGLLIKDLTANISFFANMSSNPQIIVHNIKVGGVASAFNYNGTGTATISVYDSIFIGASAFRGLNAGGTYILSLQNVDITGATPLTNVGTMTVTMNDARIGSPSANTSYTGEYSDFVLNLPSGTHTNDLSAAFIILPDDLGNAPFHRDHVKDFRVTFVSASSVSIGNGEARDFDDDFNIINTGGIVTVDITSSGVNGLDVGVEAPNTWYAIFAIADQDNILAFAGLLSISTTAPTLPAGYESFRQTGWVRNDVTSTFLEFQQIGKFNDVEYRYEEEASALTLLSSGSATTFSTFNLGSLISPTCEKVKINFQFNNAGDGREFRIRPFGSSLTTPPITGQAGKDNGTDFVHFIFDIILPASASQAIQYEVDNLADNLNVVIISFEDER